MKFVIGLLSAPLWLPVLLSAASASLMLGGLMVVGGLLLKGRVHDPDDWTEPPDLA